MIIGTVALLVLWIQLPKLLTSLLKTFSICAADSTPWWQFFTAVDELRGAGGVHCSGDDVSTREDIDVFITAFQRITCGGHRIELLQAALKLLLTSKSRKLRKWVILPSLVKQVGLAS